ncbi:MAG: ribonuclease HII [Candidatus Nanopelagicales bacterium]
MAPTLELENSLFDQGFDLVAGIDEVGRGCLAGPVSIGICLVDAKVNQIPKNLNDSKLLTAQKRDDLIPKIEQWAKDYAVGHSSNEEIDHFGLAIALQLAATRAIMKLSKKPQAIILDGKHNWLKTKNFDLFSTPPKKVAEELDFLSQVTGASHTIAQTKADQTCASVSAASVLAKVERDQIITNLGTQFEQYGWATNKGYASPDHLAAIKNYGPTKYHRISWKPFI